MEKEENNAWDLRKDASIIRMIEALQPDMLGVRERVDAQAYFFCGTVYRNAP